MVYPKNGWLGMGIQCAITTFVVAIVAMGCASPQAPMGDGEDSMVQTIGDVTVSREGEESVVYIDGLVDPIYSVTTSEEGNLVVVDLVAVVESDDASAMGELGDAGRQVAAYDGVVDLVTLSTFDDEDGDTPLTRVEIVMAEAGDAEIFSTGDGLEIRIVPGVLEAEVADSMDSWSEEVAEPMTDDSEMMVSEELVMEEVSIVPPPAATQLTNISAQMTGEGVLVGLETDGAVGGLEAFTLSDPARLVVDLPGIMAGPKAQNVSLDSGYVTGIRLGAHDGKVRVVIDGGVDAADFQGRQIMPGTTGLWIAIGGGAELAQAMDTALDAADMAWTSSMAANSQMDAPGTGAEAALAAEDAAFEAVIGEMVAPETESDPVVAAADEAEAEAEAEAVVATEVAAVTGLAEVYGLHYERTETMDRTAILSDDAVAYTTSSPDATTLVVSISGARISEEASDRIFPKAGGPVSMIHAFQQPEVTVPEVRVVFTRAPNQQPVMSRRGSMLFVDFEDMGVAAAAPPAFPNAGQSESVEQNVAVNSATIGSSEAASPTFQELTQAEAGEVVAEVPAAPESAGEMDPAAAVAMLVASEQGVDPATGLPAFESGTEMVAIPASLDSGAEAWVGNVPAAVEVPAAIEVLEEGGLIDGKEYRGRRVSLDFKDVAIADVLRLIAEVSDLNIIAGDEVAGNVTIRLVEVPWDQALDVILMTKGLGFVRVGNVLRIAPSDVLKAEEEVRLQERRNKEKLEDLEVKLLPVNYAAVKDTEGLVKRLLSARGTVNLDTRTNTLIIKDISSVIDEASALIAAIDTQTPQVMIEAKIVEANLDFSRELGSVWGIGTQRFTDPFDPDTPRRDLGSQDLRFIDQNNLAFSNPITSVPTGLMNFGALILDEDFRIDAQIQAAESTGDGKVVSSPRIVTLDNKEARIEQGVSIPFQTFEGGDAKLEFIDAVLSLVVTPHITADESIIMEIEVTRNAPDDTVATPTGSPAIAKNVAETETLVKDGQTLVLGGIYTIIKSQRQSRIPYLHRIPVIGNAFKNNEVTDARKELLVFVTPRVVRLPEMAEN